MKTITMDHDEFIRECDKHEKIGADKMYERMNKVYSTLHKESLYELEQKFNKSEDDYYIMRAKQFGMFR